MPPEANENRPGLWQGLEEYMDSPAFHKAMADEFPENAAEWTDPVTRRQFVTLMGASLALAGAAGCSPRPASQGKIAPYTTQPEQLIPGVPLLFASAAPLCGYVTGVLVHSREGRPIKVEGNPDHPSSLGGTDVFTQASILDMYDPDRSKQIAHLGSGVSYESAITALRAKLEALRGKKGAGFRLLTETITSPTLADQLEALLRDYPEARWAQFDAIGRDNIREGAKKAFGDVRNVYYDFTKADVVLALDADFLSVGPGHVRYCRDFGSRRKVRKAKQDGVSPDQMSRLYAVECMPSTTGSVADHRLALRSGQIEGFGRALAAQLGVPGAAGLQAGNLPDEAKKWLAPLAKDLINHKGKCAVVVGESQPASLHALAHAINSHLGNVRTEEKGQQPVVVTASIEAPFGADAKKKVIDLRTLVDEMGKGQVDTLFILGGNPAFTAPVDVPFIEAIKKMKEKKERLTVHVGLFMDETAVLCDYHFPEAHYLEGWGDGRGHDGTIALQQVLIAPMYAGKSYLEFFADLTSAPIRESRELVKAYWKRRFTTENRGGEFEVFWQQVVRSGVVPGTAAKPEGGTLAGNWAEGAKAPPSPPATGEFEINFRPDPTIFDGRYANNGWLQELPKPVTTMTWDNAVYISPKTGKEMKLDKDYRWTAGERGRVEVTVVELSLGGRKVKAPIWMLPGHPEGAITVHLGYGRERAGRVGNTPAELNAEGQPTRGFDAYALRVAGAPWFSNGVAIKKTDETYILAIVQGNWSMVEKDPFSGKELDRKPVHRATLDEYKNNPEFAKLPPESPGETEEIDANVPAPHKPESGLSKQHPHPSGPDQGPGTTPEGQAVGHPTGEGPHKPGHDHRLTPLTMYRENIVLAPDLKEKQLRRWAMAIDLSSCTGCNACVIACVSENNLPTVGKHEVTRAHEMHWIRVDRYYSGDPNDPAKLETYFQPVPCQQCEKAPCEVVCPVGATVHSVDGLNDMVYNRCVGTRYCSNNCPYKVRRFNFLTFQDWATDSIKLGRNPDVSVRSRGVMEKCTYCVQRIRAAEIVAEREARGIRDGEVVTACQAACPSNAIAFGDLQLTHGAVSRWKLEPTNYGLLAELNTMPRTTYLAKLRNLNPDMPKGA